ncbi:MAG TPA: glycosyltransferase family 2 protein [Chlamydiales bacterium]|nr:glycosyltransferase family 2 protein [Chlamydiales bacterium]
MKTRSTIAIIPCYDVAPFCEKVICDTIRFVDHVIVIDDGSRDGTTAILKTLAARYPEQISAQIFPKNRGKGVVLLEGFRYSLSHFAFKTLVTLDGDGQHHPEEIPLLLKAAQRKDFIIGERKFEQMPWKSKFANSIVSWLLRWIHPNAPLDTQSGMRAFSKPLVQKIAQSIPGGGYEMEFRCLLLALQPPWQLEEVPITTTYIEKNRFSHFSAIKDSIKILRVLVSHILRKQ